MLRAAGKKILVINTCLIVCCVYLNCFGQSAKSNGSLRLEVSDQFDYSINAAEVLLKDSSGSDLRAFTDENGIAQISLLSTEKYQLIINSEGFQSYRDDDIKVLAGEIKTVKIVLKVAEIETKIDVKEENSLENFAGSRTLTSEEIESLPDDPQQLEQALRRLAGPTLTGEEQTISVNGFTGGKLPPKQAIQRVRINQDIFSAQYETNGGGGIEVITKAGFDKYSGGIGFSFNDDKLNAKDSFLKYRPPSQSRYIGTHFSGPLKQKRASFSFDVDHWQNDRSSVINAVILNQSFQSIELKESVRAFGRKTAIASRADYDISEKYKIYVTYQYDNNQTSPIGAGGFNLLSRSYKSQNSTHTFQLSETALVNKRIVNQTRFQYINRQLKDSGENNDTAIIVQDAFSAGGAQINRTNQFQKFELSNDTTWQFKNYALTFGGRIRDAFDKDNSLSNFGGTYIFNGGKAPLLDENNNLLLDNDGNIITTNITSLERYRRTLVFRGLGYDESQIRKLGGGANQFLIEGGAPQAKVNQFDVALYLQNSLTLRKDLALSFGLRYENQNNIKSHSNFAPRFGIIWAPKNDKKKKSALFSLPRISGGAGIFYRRISEDLILESLRFENSSRLQYIVDDFNVIDSLSNAPSPDLLRQFALPVSKRVIDPDLQTPYEILFNINANKELPSGISLFVSISHINVKRALRSRNINAPFAESSDSNNVTSVFPLGANMGNIYQTESNGIVKTNILFLRLMIPSKFGRFDFNYILKKSKDNLVTGSGSSFNPYDFSDEFAPSDSDVRHNFSISTLSKLPFGIKLSNTFYALSGLPFNITTGQDTNGDGLYTERPSFAAEPDTSGLISSPFGLLNPTPNLTEKIIPRNYGRGPASFYLDTYLSRSITFGNDKKRKYTLTVAVQITNILNITNKSNPVGNISSPYFLRSISYTSRGGVPGPRRIVFSSGVRF